MTALLIIGGLAVIAIVIALLGLAHLSIGADAAQQAQRERDE